MCRSRLCLEAGRSRSADSSSFLDFEWARQLDRLAIAETLKNTGVLLAEDSAEVVGEGAGVDGPSSLHRLLRSR